MKGSLSCSRTKLEVVRTSEVHPRIMNIMKIGAALALAAVKVSRGWSRHLKETSSRGFQAAAGIAAAAKLKPKDGADASMVLFTVLYRMFLHTSKSVSRV